MLAVEWAALHTFGLSCQIAVVVTVVVSGQFFWREFSRRQWAQLAGRIPPDPPLHQ